MRLFAAVTCPDPWVRDILVLRGKLERRYPNGVSWIAPQALHMTVRFIGSVDEAFASALIAIWSSSQIILSSPLTLIPDRWGCFPAHGPERIVWVGVRVESGSWTELVERVDALLATLGSVQTLLRDEVPHITVGRIRNARVTLGMRDDVRELEAASDSMRISNVALLSSLITPTGAIYTEEASTGVVTPDVL